MELLVYPILYGLFLGFVIVGGAALVSFAIYGAIELCVLLWKRADEKKRKKEEHGWWDYE